MRLILTLLFVTWTAAATITYIPSGNRILVLKSATDETLKNQINQKYPEQDSRAFYSYDYADEASAKTDYNDSDGDDPPKDFYSYVDTNGKLQTIRYLTARQEEYKASDTNLPRASEVQRAKQAHFETYRTAELQASLAPTGIAKTSDSIDQHRLRESYIEAAILRDSKEQQQQQQQREKAVSQEEMDRSKTLEEEEMRNIEEAINAEELQRQQEFQRLQQLQIDIELQRQRQQQQQEKQQQQSPQDDDDEFQLFQNLRTIYNLEDDRSTRVLKLPSFQFPTETQPQSQQQRQHSSAGYQFQQQQQQKQQQQNQQQSSEKQQFQQQTSYATIQRDRPQIPLSPAKSIDSIRVPVNSYYTLMSPSTQYSVITPTVLATVPHEEIAKLGQKLPVSISSSFLSHRIKSKNI